jgi:hypothetical protein
LGDQDFEKFINDGDTEDTKVPFFLLVSVREKLNAINDLYNTSLEHYSKIGDKDGLKADMHDFISKLMAAGINGLEQLNMIMATEIDDDYPDEEEGDPDGSEKPE